MEIRISNQIAANARKTGNRWPHLAVPWKSREPKF